MENDITRAIQRLQRTGISALIRKYEDVFGEPSKVVHKQHLMRRIAWRLQAQAKGDLSEAARARIGAIAHMADLSNQALHTLHAGPARPVTPISSCWPHPRDPRLPAVGTVLRRRYQGQDVAVRVLADGFEYDSKQYRCLSAVARQVTGTQWNGLLFFGLTGRRDD